jgi:hypothetical protein
MKSFLPDIKPNFGEAKVTLKDDSGNATDYQLVSIKGNGCYFSASKDGVETSYITFSRQDLKALFLMLCTEK